MEKAKVKILGIKPDTTLVVFYSNDLSTIVHKKDYKKIDIDFEVEKQREITVVLHSLDFHHLRIEELFYDGDSTLLIDQKIDPYYINKNEAELMKLFEKKCKRIVREKMINKILNVENPAIDLWIRRYETNRRQLFLDEKANLFEEQKSQNK